MLPQETEQSEQGQAEDGGIFAVDGVEQLDARAFETVGADAGKNGVILEREVVVEEGVAELAHAELGPCDVPPNLGAVFVTNDRGDQGVVLAAEALKLGPGSREVGRFVEPLVIADQELVGTNDQRIRRADPGGLQA